MSIKKLINNRILLCLSLELMTFIYFTPASAYQRLEVTNMWDSSPATVIGFTCDVAPQTARLGANSVLVNYGGVGSWPLDTPGLNCLIVNSTTQIQLAMVYVPYPNSEQDTIKLISCLTAKYDDCNHYINITKTPQVNTKTQEINVTTPLAQSQSMSKQ